MSLSTFQKIFFWAVVPLAAATIGGVATYISAQPDKEQIVISGDAVKAAKDGKLTIEIIRKEESSHLPWPAYFSSAGVLVGLAAMLWAGEKR